MSLALWIAAGLLATVALVGGISKVFVPREKTGRDPRWGVDRKRPRRLRQDARVLELLVAVGLVLPAVVDMAPVMVPVTAGCWVLLMVGAMITHLRHGEVRFVALNLGYLALAAFIAWGRFGPESFTA